MVLALEMWFSLISQATTLQEGYFGGKLNHLGGGGGKLVDRTLDVDTNSATTSTSAAPSCSFFFIRGKVHTWLF